MLCESVNSDQEEKEGDLLNSYRIINLKNLIINIDNFLVCKECAQEKELQIKLALGGVSNTMIMVGNFRVTKGITYVMICYVSL